MRDPEAFWAKERLTWFHPPESTLELDMEVDFSRFGSGRLDVASWAENEPGQSLTPCEPAAAR